MERLQQIKIHEHYFKLKKHNYQPFKLETIAILYGTRKYRLLSRITEAS